MPDSPPPRGAGPATLCVDLDGTLVATDTLFESLVLLLRRHPLQAFHVAAWLLRGRAFLKQQVAARVVPDPASWPYRAEVVDFLRGEQRRGRYLVLATASDERVARAAADHLGLFREVLASDGKVNLKGERKARALAERFGPKGFVYAGDTAADLPVWRAAEAAIVVAASPRLEARVRRAVPIEATLAARPPGPASPLLRLLRVHHWVKNLLLLVPLLTAHRFADPAAWLQELRAIAALCLLASAVYVVNDLLDLQADRAHRSKRHRPLADGSIRPRTGLALAAAALLGSAALAQGLPAPFWAWCAVYAATAVAYSLWMKRVPGLDVAVLAFLYTVRILLGAAAIGVPPSASLMLFAAFLFLSLALLKRHAELEAAAREGSHAAEVRGYRVADRRRVLAVGVASGLTATLVVALYVLAPHIARHYGEPAWLWGLAPLLLAWLGRAWWIGHRGAMHDDPIVFALCDPASWLVVAAMIALVVAAL